MEQVHRTTSIASLIHDESKFLQLLSTQSHQLNTSIILSDAIDRELDNNMSEISTLKSIKPKIQEKLFSRTSISTNDWNTAIKYKCMPHLNTVNNKKKFLNVNNITTIQELEDISLPPSPSIILIPPHIPPTKVTPQKFHRLSTTCQQFSDKSLDPKRNVSSPKPKGQPQQKLFYFLTNIKPRSETNFTTNTLLFHYEILMPEHWNPTMITLNFMNYAFPWPNIKKML